jgi:Family of unknown function (DUF6459)
MTVPLVVRGQVRLRPAPAYDPPYDDELAPEWWAAGALQPLLELPTPSDEEPATPRPALWTPPQPGSSPAAAAAATQFVNTCLEILNGYRPVTHFRVLAHPMEAPAVLAEMTRAIRRFRQAVGRDALLRRRTMRTCEPRPGVAEIALVVGADPPARRRAVLPARSTAPKVWALAYRLEQRHSRWLCTAAQLL